MVATPTDPQRLSARDGGENGEWGPLQIATPLIVGGVLLLAFVAYFIWQRNPLCKRDYDYHPVRPEWLTKIERLFVSRRTRTRVLRASVPVTIDESIRTPSLGLDFRRARQYRSGSSDSQTPLTSTSYPFDYPPHKTPPDSPPPTPRRRAVRWWWLFGSRPQEIKSQDPGTRWRIDGPDGSSTGHGHNSHGQEEYHARHAEPLEAVREYPEIGDDVIRIGDSFASVASTPMTQHFPEQVRAAHGMPSVPAHPGSRTRTPAPANPGTPVSSANRGLPPSYDASQTQTRFASTEDILRLPRSEPRYMITPAHTAASPRALHGRELSTDSFLAAQPPMAASSIY